MTKYDDAARRRVRWLTRRGLLELDIVLGRFMQENFDHLSDDEIGLFCEILEWPDQDFLAIVNEKQEPEEERFMALVKKIRQC